MKEAQQRLAEVLETVKIQDADPAVVKNVDARASRSGSELRAALLRQVSSPVLWQQSVEVLIQRGVNHFIEAGPGKVLVGLLRQIDRQAIGLNVEDSTSLSVAREKLMV
jgi:[acyl-carrier-protein] S-malonyltransferase